jgi:hypothetical protein
VPLIANPPSRYWVSTDLSSLFTAMNLTITGSIFSSGLSFAAENPALLAKYLDGSLNYVPFVHNQASDISAPSAYQLTTTRNYRVELLLEDARRQVNPLLPSRLSAVFAVETKSEAIKLAKASSRPVGEVFEFELVPGELNRVARANFHIVGLLRDVLDQASWSVAHLLEIGRAYWNGDGEIAVDIPSPTAIDRRQKTCRVAWEYLIEGRLDRVGGPLGFSGGRAAGAGTTE